MPGPPSSARPAATVTRPASMPAGAPSTRPCSTGMPSSEASATSKPGMALAGPVITARDTVPASSCMRWKSSELRTSEAIRRTPSSRIWRACSTICSIAGDILDGVLHADVGQPAVGVLERQRGALGELDGEGLDAAAGGAGEGALGAAGDREVGEAADGEVEDELVVGAGAVQRADRREGGEVDALGLQPGGAQRREDALDHLAACRDEQHALATARGVVDDGERLVVEHRVLERHRKLVLRLEAHGGLELLGVLEVGQVDDAHDDLLVGEADADALVQALVLAVQRPQGLGQAVDVGDLAVADDPRLERRERGALDAQTAVDRRPTRQRCRSRRCRARRGSWCAWPWEEEEALGGWGAETRPPLIGSGRPGPEARAGACPTCVHGPDRPSRGGLRRCRGRRRRARCPRRRRRCRRARGRGRTAPPSCAPPWLPCAR